MMKTRAVQVCLFAALSCCPLAAQTIRAAIYGTVLDPSGSGVPNATVRAIHVSTNTETTFVTDPSGTYDFPRLIRFGEYRLEAEAKGFRKLVREGVNIVVDQRAKIDLQMEVGNIAQAVEVVADASLLETSNATPGQYVPKSLVDSLPLL